MQSIPDDVTAYRQTPIFNEETIPGGLLRAHRTRAGTWAKILVLEGSLAYRILEPVPEAHTLDAQHPGVIEPQVLHEVAPLGPVRFKVVFFRASA